MQTNLATSLHKFMIILILVWQTYECLIHVCIRLCPSVKTIVLCTNVTHTLHINKTEKEALKFEHSAFPRNWRKWEHV